MTTQSKDNQREFVGPRNEADVIAADIIYEGSAVGLVTATGDCRPLQAGDGFMGFAEDQTDNSAGAAGALRQRTIDVGRVQLAVSGAVATDFGQPVYATDDNTFVFSPVAAVFVGFVTRFVSSGVVVVDFNALSYQDPYAALGANGFYEVKSGAYTLDIEDNGKVIFVDTTAVITLPAVATPVTATIVCIGPYGTVQISLDPNANDLIHAPDLAGTLNKDHINTLATAQRGDLCTVSSGAGDADGYAVLNQRGTWAQEA